MEYNRIYDFIIPHDMMKQKWKVKSLLSQKQNKKTLFLTTLLLVLSLILCIWTATIITSSVIAQDSEKTRKKEFISNETRADDDSNGTSTSQNTFEKFVYTWIDDTKEVIYGMKFVDPENLLRIVTELKIENTSLYISSGSVVVNSASSNNTGDDSKYGHILWWNNNKIVGVDDVTIIAWEGNQINTWKDLWILWGTNNEITAKGLIYPESILLIWWSWNKHIRSLPSGWTDNVLIWWLNNTIWEDKNDKWSSNVFILWWMSNAVKTIQFSTNEKPVYSDNVTVWWKNVTVSSKRNIFVYSNTWDFQPQSSNAFYLNMDKWVWLNTTWVAGWLSVGGAVSIESINIDNTPCNSGNFWVIGSYIIRENESDTKSYRCIIWCTENWAKEGVWELIDGWDKCKDGLKDKKILVNAGETDTTSADKNYIDAQCSEWVDTWNATMCSFNPKSKNAYLDLFKNVIFETTLIDSDDPCPVWQENQCVFKCNSGYHLTWTTDGGSFRCYKDCPLPWDETKTIKHNQTVIWYNITDVDCSNGSYEFPLRTIVTNLWEPNFIPANSIITVNGKVQNWKSPETCGNYAHKKTLICFNWELHLINNKWQAIKNSTGIAQQYKYESCNLHNYRCDTSYNLTQSDIQNTKLDQPQNTGSWTVADRGTLKWIRWQYQECIDYNANPSDPSVKWESCGVSTYRYKFLRCNIDWYDLQSDGVCRKKCTLTGTNGTLSKYTHGTTVTWYVATWATCTWTCEAASLFCDDWKWRLSNKNGAETTKYQYNDCILSPKVCKATTYNVSHEIFLQHSGTSIYDSCDAYNPNGKFACTLSGTTYQLTGCKSWYHTENNKRCIDNARVKDCKKWEGGSGYWVRSIWGGVSNYPRNAELNKSLTVDRWQYIEVWTWEWNKGRWTWIYPSNACDWECESWRHKNSAWTWCTKNICSWWDKRSDTAHIKQWSTRPSGNGNQEWSYNTWAYKNDIWSCKWWCEDGYHRSWNKCVENDCHYCANKWWFPYCFPIDFGGSCIDNDYYYGITQ